MKIDHRKTYYLVLDTETANTLEEPLVYDLGFAVCDKYGNIYEEHSFAIYEVFCQMKDIMQTAYYANKLPQYYEGIKSGKWEIRRLMTVRKIIKNTIEKYNIKAVCAYNACFDIRALNTTLRYVTKSAYRWFLPYGTEVYCIWHIACQTILLQKTFSKMAWSQGWYKETTGNCLTNAEVSHRYINKVFDFEENHTGLEDVRIEVGIFAKCLAQHKGGVVKSPNWLCWRLPQPQFKACRPQAA